MGTSVCLCAFPTCPARSNPAHHSPARSESLLCLLSILPLPRFAAPFGTPCLSRALPGLELPTRPPHRVSFPPIHHSVLLSRTRTPSSIPPIPFKPRRSPACHLYSFSTRHTQLPAFTSTSRSVHLRLAAFVCIFFQVHSLQLRSLALRCPSMSRRFVLAIDLRSLLQAGIRSCPLHPRPTWDWLDSYHSQPSGFPPNRYITRLLSSLIEAHGERLSR